MLFKNGERYKMTPADEKGLDFNPEKKPRLIYPKERVRPSLAKDNRLPDKPKSISFPLTAIRTTDKGIDDVWTYCDNYYKDNNGNMKFSPRNFSYTGMVSIKNKELLFWFKKVCPWCENGDNFSGKIPKCRIEDLAGDARRRVQEKSANVEFETLLYNERLGLSEEKLRTIAKAYFINGVDEMSLDQVKLALETYVKRDKLEGVSKFLKLADADTIIEIKSRLQKAIDDRIIVFMLRDHKWAWVTENGKKNIEICKISAASEPNNALYEYYLNSSKFQKELLSRLEGMPYFDVNKDNNDNSEE